jgi:hypothetical protein
MSRSTRHIRDVILAAASALTILWATPGSASNALDFQAAVRVLVSDINKGDVKSVTADCAPHASIVDGFPPYAWQTCAGWMKSYVANNKAIHATLGVLSTGKSIYTEVKGDNAYAIYPVTFTDRQNGKQISYKGSMTVTLEHVASGWVFTGVASAWSANTL